MGGRVPPSAREFARPLTAGLSRARVKGLRLSQPPVASRHPPIQGECRNLSPLRSARTRVAPLLRCLRHLADVPPRRLMAPSARSGPQITRTGGLLRKEAVLFFCFRKWLISGPIAWKQLTHRPFSLERGPCNGLHYPFGGCQNLYEFNGQSYDRVFHQILPSLRYK